MPAIDIVTRLRQASRGYEEWRVADKVSGAFCMSFSRSDYMDPEREARKWLDEHMKSYPDHYAKYEVRREVAQSEDQLLAAEAANMIEGLLRGEFVCLKCGLRKDSDNASVPEF